MSIVEPSGLVICTVNGKAITLGAIAPTLKVEGRWSLVDEAVREAVLDEAAAARGILVSDDELQRAADDFRVRHKLHGAAQTQAWLRARNLTVEEFEQGLTRGLTVAKLRDAIDEDEVRRYFFDHLKSFQWARYSQLVSRDRETAEELLAHIRDDEMEFASAARQHSIDRDTGQAGGYAGTWKRSDLSPAMETLVFSAPIGEVSGPVETRQGWHVVKVWERGGGAFDDEASAVAREAVFEHWLKRQIDRASVEARL
jgi:parvulin-like peptidyl-prolyl isomerase